MANPGMANPARESDPIEAAAPSAALADLGIPVIHVAEDAADASDRSLARVAELCAGKEIPIRLRLPLMLWDPEKFQYISWRGEIWKVEVRDAEEAEQLKSALEAFFKGVGRLGADRVRGRLERELGVIGAATPAEGTSLGLGD